jgi:hypothetical protein
MRRLESGLNSDLDLGTGEGLIERHLVAVTERLEDPRICCRGGGCCDATVVVVVSSGIVVVVDDVDVEVVVVEAKGGFSSCLP